MKADRRRRGAAILALVAALTAAGVAAPGASAADPDPSCGSPLGVEAKGAANWVVAGGGDPEYAMVDAMRMPGGQRSPELMLSAWGKLVLVAEVKVDQGTNFTWAIMARIHSNTTGWNTTPIWLSSPVTSEYYPQGAHIRPSAVFWNDRIWVAWDAQGSTLGGQADRFILVRSFDRNLSADATRVASSANPATTVQHPALAVTSSGLALAYSTSDGDSTPGDTHIVARRFDGVAFLPEATVSPVGDGASDGLPALAADSGSSLYLAWVKTTASGASSDLMFAMSTGPTWGPPAELARLGRLGAGGPAVALFEGWVHVAYSTAFPADLSGTDSEVRLIRIPEAGGTPGAPFAANPEPTGGNDESPTLSLVDGKLAIGWSTTEDFVYSHSSDTDPVFRFWDGAAFGPVFELSEADDNASDGAPAFAQVGGHVYAHWMQTPPQQPGDPRGNSRELVRLVSRPPQWYDNLTVRYAIRPSSDNGSHLVEVSSAAVDLSGHDLALRLPDGSLVELSREARPQAWAPVNPSAPDFEVLACGREVRAEPVPVEPPPPPVNVGPLLAGLALAAAAALVVVWDIRRGRRERGP